MVTVIIPVLNEAETVQSVIRFAFENKHVTEVIVVDDKSFDDTVTKSIEAGAKVITSTKLGKGASMKEGMLCATNEILLFLDGD
ncbi:MAG TPA: glycosyltransferase, partial [Lacibacter sp.]|nr:glycosyltransferase [Lacibacter sp.]